MAAKPPRKPGKTSGHEVVFYTYPKLLFAWPLILAGYALWMIDRWEWISPEALGWIWGIVLMATVLTIGVDIGRNAMAFWVVLIVALWFLGLWLSEKQYVTVFGDIYRFFAGLDASYSRGLGLTVSIWLSIAYIVMLIWSRINDKWRFTHNEFEHRAFGKVDWSAARAAKTVRTSYPDLLEALFCLAGDLIIYDARGSRVIRTIPHVPLLPLLRRRINVIIEFTAVTTAQLEDEEDAADGDEREPDPGARDA